LGTNNNWHNHLREDAARLEGPSVEDYANRIRAALKVADGGLGEQMEHII
jgi:hypothetical protein